MTDDPERLLRTQAGLDPLERELLASVQRVSPPAGAKDAAWSALATQLVAGAVAASAAAPSSAAAAAKAGAGSWLSGALAAKAALTLVAGGVVVGGYLAVQHARQTPERAITHARARPVATASPQPTAQEAPADVTPAAQPDPAAQARPQARPIKRATEPRRPDRLAAESALLAEARAQLRAGDARGAQQALERLEVLFPHGVLTQEREVLAIELLATQGDAAAAQRRARAFVSAHPESPHSAKLRSFLVAP